MAPTKKTSRKASGSEASPSAMAKRLREFAKRLATEPSLSARLRNEIESALAKWEQDLEAQQTMALDSSPGEQRLEGKSARVGSPGGGEAAGSIRIWCDGSCSPNPGAGGWGAIVERNGVREELSGSAPESTNNIMEMTAAIEALGATPEGAVVTVTTDSQYVKNGITKWIHAWKRKGWRKADGGAVLNQQLWRKLDALASARRVEWAWIRGHSGHPENERCDELAVQARLNQST